jgi:Rab proteins geranylgeranyltransferase component A
LLDHSSQPLNAEDLLRPYLDAALSLAPQTSESSVQYPFTIFYKQNFPPPLSSSVDTQPTHLYPQPLDSVHLPEIADSMVGSAEATFWRAIEQLKAVGRQPQATEKEGEQDEIREIDSLWPPLEYVEEDQEEW